MNNSIIIEFEITPKGRLAGIHIDENHTDMPSNRDNVRSDFLHGIKITPNK